MKIAIATSGRFHALDLARELNALGHEVTFYSYVPKRRAARFGLPLRCHRSFFLLMAPLIAMQRTAPLPGRAVWARRLRERLDSAIADRLEPCDVFIGMSGICVESARTAKEKYGATVFIERGSRHILSQKAILDSIQAKSGNSSSIPGYAVERELTSYSIADFISVPSHHVVQSFVDEGIAKNRIFRNPYGADLSMFAPTESPPPEPPTLIMVGCWSLQKGADVLLEAWQTLSHVNLLHVGSVADAKLSSNRRFSHHKPVPQWRLRNFYGRAHVAVLPSRQDGFGLVLAQALACGLPIVCTDKTGGEDLKRLLEIPRVVRVVPTEDSKALAAAIKKAFSIALAGSGTRDILGSKREHLSWKAYGLRYSRFLESLLN